MLSDMLPFAFGALATVHHAEYCVSTIACKVYSVSGRREANK